MSVPTPPMLTCPQWGARKPTHPPTVTGRPDKIIIHHTAGHAGQPGNVKDANSVQAVSYAKALQNDMMDNRRWSDSGHNFLVMRSGYIVQGRWGTVTAIEHGRMVISAHCPGQNDQPGIEHEHISGEVMTDAQWHASIWLQAWIADQCSIRATNIHGHREFYATACPDVLEGRIMQMRLQVATWLTYYKHERTAPRRFTTAKRAVRRELKH